MTLRLTYAPWGETLAEIVDAARAAEAAGAEVVWAPELHRSATVTAAALAAGTTTVGVGTAIALAFTRSPMVTALEAMDLDEMSQRPLRPRPRHRRAAAQRGLAQRAVGQAGRAPARDGRASSASSIARCTDGEPIEVDGEYEHARIKGYQRPYHRQRAEIPIYLAGMGPVMTARRRRDRRRLDQPRAVQSPRSSASRCCPRSPTGLERAGKRARRRRPRRLGVLRGRHRRRSGASPCRRASSASTPPCAPTPTSSPSTASPTTRRASSTPSSPARSPRRSSATWCRDAMVDTLTIAGTPDDVAEPLAAYDGVVDSVKLSPPTHGLDAARDPRRRRRPSSRSSQT